MQTEEQFVEEHFKVCSKKNAKHGKRHPAKRRECGRKTYRYLLKWRPERIDIFNSSSKEKRIKLRICSK